MLAAACPHLDVKIAECVETAYRTNAKAQLFLGFSAPRRFFLRWKLDARKQYR